MIGELQNIERPPEVDLTDWLVESVNVLWNLLLNVPRGLYDRSPSYDSTEIMMIVKIIDFTYKQTPWKSLDAVNYDLKDVRAR